MNASLDRVLLAGASGDTGRRILPLLARSDLAVRALTRSPANAEPLERRGADEIVIGDLTDRSDAERAVEGIDLVLTAVGSTPLDVLSSGPLVDGRGTITLVEAAAAAGVEAIVMESSLGVGGDRASVLACLFRATIRPVVRAKTRAEASIHESGLRYTIFRPGLLTDGSPTDDVQVAPAETGLWGAVSRADVARLMVAAPFTPEAADRTFEVVRNPLLRRRALAIDWRSPRTRPG